MLIKMSSEKPVNEQIIDEALDNILNSDGVHSVKNTSFLVEGMPYFYKGFYLQCFSNDGVRWKGWARPKHTSKIKEFESNWHLSEKEAGQNLTMLIDLYTGSIC